MPFFPVILGDDPMVHIRGSYDPRRRGSLALSYLVQSHCSDQCLVLHGRVSTCLLPGPGPLSVQP